MKYTASLVKLHIDERISERRAEALQRGIPVADDETLQFLLLTLAAVRPKRILEIGTAIGYSGHVILGACEGHLYTIEADENSLTKANEFFAVSGYKERVTTYLGDANEIVPYFSGTFDFIFLDGPKTRYIQYLPYLKRMLTKSGILLCDNVLFNGMVSGEKELVKKKATIVNALDLFLRAVTADEDFMTSVLPVGDGVALCIRKDN